MYRNRNFSLVLFVTINFLFNGLANAGIMKRSIRMVREVYPPDVEPENENNQAQAVCIVGDVVYGAEEPVPAEQPCLKCRCRPPGVQCETVQCAKKPGCKAIHRPNRCCPDYQCECEHNGKIYANGEKLETNPGGECKVCYCRGGEVQCAEVSCYIRKDCEGKRVPGTCCPKYDHCPPIDAVLDRNSFTTETPPNTLKPVVLELWQESVLNSTENPGSTPSLNTILEETNKVPDTEELVTAAPTYEEIPNKEEEILPRITIQEIIPERKEIPITAPPRNLISDLQGTLLIEEAIPTSDNASNDLNIDADPESSEVSEVFQHPPPILRIGDKLLFLKKGELVPEKDTSSPQTVITIIGAEGLQRGGVEDSLEVHEFKIDPEVDIQHIRKESIEPEVETALSNETQAEIEALPTAPNGISKAESTKVDDTTETNDLELKVAESTHILSLVKKGNKKSNSEESATTVLTQTSSTSNSEILVTESTVITTTITPEPAGTTTTDETNVDTTIIPTTTVTPVILSSTELPKAVEVVSDQNPAYPPLPDSMPAVGDTSQKFEVELENDNSTTMEIKILPDVLEFLSNKTGPPKNASHPEWLKTDDSTNVTQTLLGYKEMELPQELLNQKSPIDDNDTTSTEAITSTTSTVKDGLIDSIEHVLSETERSVDQLIGEVKLDNSYSEPFSVEPTRTTSTIMPKDTEDLVKETFKSVTGNFSDVSEEKEIPLRSVESLEIEESKEQTTQRVNNSAIIGDVNASVEKSREGEPSSEASDMLLSSSGIELGSVEIVDPNTKPVLADVEMIDGVKETNRDLVNEGKENSKDVEIINVLNTPKPTKSDKIESSTYEFLPTPEETKSKKLSKREATTESPDDVFKDLEKELNSETSFSTKDDASEKAESDAIFQELLEESDGKKSNVKSRSPEQEKVDNIGNTIAGFLFKGKVPDAGIFQLVGGLFGNQRA